jgi:serine/threonine-protein kinase
MELLPGGTLEGECLSREEAAAVAAGLAHAHGRSVVHRDLKPANLLRSARGQVKIVDFGIARALEETMVTQVGTVLGTVRYRAPEQGEGRVVGTAADVYSLGVVFDELLDGATASDVELIERMRDPDPNARPTAAQVATALGATEVAAPVTEVLPRRRARAGARTKMLAAVAAAAAGIGTAIAIVAAVGKETPPRVEPVPHASTPAEQARNLSAWLQRYSR